jgi:hypothetical protein
MYSDNVPHSAEQTMRWGQWDTNPLLGGFGIIPPLGIFASLGIGVILDSLGWNHVTGAPV